MARTREKLTLASMVAAAFGFVLAYSGPAAAQDDPPDWESGGFVEPTEESTEGETTTPGSSQIPTPITLRPLTLPERTLRIDVGPPDRALLDSGFVLGHMNGYGLRIADDGPDVFTMLGIGAAFGVMDDLEVGTLLLPIIMSPDGDFGDMTFYGRYRFFQNDVVQIGGQLALALPTNDLFGMGFGLPISFYLIEKLRIDTGIEFELTKIIDVDGTILNLVVPVAVTFNVLPEVFLGGRIGIEAPDFDTWLMPIGFFGGYTHAGKVTTDITGAFTFFVSEGDTDWQLVFGANIHLDV